ncbi:hypothetical protein [Microvirga thermotolerans]|uniref:Secreted protein n=1 Tax=Microvirga thermotolerans TaxID=2651334 RepID=A0A5P9JX17_9HYPH|nr:hypothetical protein [Microvirga thermotolerans]QFU15755.1 hypothetical protein GDR74_05705 [Microvirga thermotolerans]
MTRRSAWAIAAAGLLATCLGPAPALADAIDGDWCSDDGRRLSIAGPAIVTPGGARMQGSYTRHSFLYTAPAGEPGGGEEVSMRLLSEILVQIRFGPDRPVQTWHRCTETTS